MVFIRADLDGAGGGGLTQGRLVREDGQRGKRRIRPELSGGRFDLDAETFQFGRHREHAVGLLLAGVGDAADLHRPVGQSGDGRQREERVRESVEVEVAAADAGPGVRDQRAIGRTQLGAAGCGDLGEGGITLEAAVGVAFDADGRAGAGDGGQGDEIAGGGGVGFDRVGGLGDVRAGSGTAPAAVGEPGQGPAELSAHARGHLDERFGDRGALHAHRCSG